LEVRIERSKNRVVLALHGVTGPVRWRDLNVAREGALNEPPDQPVEFIIQMNPEAKSP
jgi:hypothetical protein